MRVARAIVTLTLVLATFARAATWSSPILHGDVPVRLIAPPLASPTSRPPLIIYLTHLPTHRIGTEPDEAILADFRAAGYLVAVLDYAGHADARWPLINREIAALRDSIQKQKGFAGHAIELSHVYIVPTGDRVMRDVVFYHDGTRTLAMDIIYPAKPANPAGTLIEFSCDNANRMGNYSLDVCTDTLLEAAATEGYAVAMADHPVAAPYKGLDPMPDCAFKIKAAVRTLRAAVAPLGGSGAIVPVGFSRGSGLALMLATTLGRSEFDGRGEHREDDSSVQGAVVLSGRFTYLDLLPTDPMIPRYNGAWGTRAAHEDVWRAAGAIDYLAAPTVPVFLSINCAESSDALHQMDVLRHRLDALHSPYEYHPENARRGHKVPLDRDVLDPMLAYLKRQLK